MPDWLDDEDGPREVFLPVEKLPRVAVIQAQEAQVSSRIRWTKRELALRCRADLLNRLDAKLKVWWWAVLIVWVAWILALIWLMGYGMHLQAELQRGPH